LGHRKEDKGNKEYDPGDGELTSTERYH